MSGKKRLNLEGLWVSEKYRSKGIGKALFQLATGAGQKLGAKSLYVSATPSENTVRFYKKSGCIPADPIDPFLFEKEPEDIYLEYRLED